MSKQHGVEMFALPKIIHVAAEFYSLCITWQCKFQHAENLRESPCVMGNALPQQLFLPCTLTGTDFLKPCVVKFNND
jgi:hypothetical protein